MRISDWSSDVCSSDLICAGLEAIAAGDGANTILIHDAARPFVDGGVVSRLIAALEHAQGVVPVLPVVDTLLRGGRNIDRTALVRVQTPQAFRFSAILSPHRAWPGHSPTVDADSASAADLPFDDCSG